ncbi:hypothetical protein [Corynebacterium mayonis]|uniref:hypothetical protein n=1 Tax=Corynebacterium mayonis TaxID=3062461 RepID=UPI0031401362
MEQHQLSNVPKLPVSEVACRESVASSQRISIFVESYSSSNKPREALIAFEFQNSEGDEVALDGWSHHSEQVGHYFYLSTAEDEGLVQDRIDLVVPESAETLVLIGKQWKSGTETFVLGNILVQNLDEGKVVHQWPSGAYIPVDSPDFYQSIPVEQGTSLLNLHTTYVPQKEQKATVPLKAHFFDEAGNELLGNADLPQSAKFGAYLSFPKGPEEETEFDLSLSVPPRARELRISGVDWGSSKVTLLRPFSHDAPVSEFFDLREFLKDLPPNQKLLIIDTTAPPLGHDTLALRPNNLAAAYSRQGIAVIFVPFGSLHEFPQVINDNLVQVPRSGFDEMIALSLELRDSTNSAFICSSLPSIQSVTAAQRLKTSGWTTIYECRDDMEEFNRVGYSKWYDPQLERQILRIVDSVISVSSALDEKLISLYPHIKDHSVSPNAVNQTTLDVARELRTEQAMLARNSSTTVGYVGHLTPSWFDWPLVLEAAKRCPFINFEIVGHGMPDGLTLPANVSYLGPKTHEELIQTVHRWKVGLIPFADIPLTRSVDPNKIYEYFAWGVAVRDSTDGNGGKISVDMGI